MTTLRLGTNSFENCEHVFALSGTPLLSARIRDQQPVVTLNLPSDISGASIRVQENVVVEGPVTVELDSEGAISLRRDQVTILHAHVEGEGTLRVTLDFRPVGLNIHTEGEALHVGGATLIGNVIADCPTAIDLAYTRAPG